MNFNYTYDNQTKTYHLKGRLLDKAPAEAIIGEIDDVLKKDAASKVNFDLAELEYISSSGLSVLIQILTKLRRGGGDLYITSVSDSVQKLLIITKLNTIFNISAS